MTPEELNRTIEFIVASQARLAAAQEQDRHDRVRFEKWSKAMTNRLTRMERQGRELLVKHNDLLVQQSALLVHQSERMDRLDRFYQDWLKQSAESQKQTENFQRQALHLLHMILDRWPPDRIV